MNSRNIPGTMPALLALAATAFTLAAGNPAAGQERGNPYGEWRYWGADAGNTRYSPLTQIDASNFGDLEIAWIWRGDNFGPSIDFILRTTPIYADGTLYGVAGRSRTAAAIDPATGETLWTFREPHTTRWERSSRQSHGKGVAYAEIDGRGVIYLVSPAFFLHALEADTGLPLEGFGGPLPIEDFGDYGTVDMLADLGHPYDPETGIPAEVGYITNTSPPIVVNGVVVVGNSNLTGRLDPRRENVPGDVLAYDARTGEHLWKFNIIPQPGEFGHDTWENDAWEWSGNINTWPPLSADLENGIVYVTTDAPTNDYFGGHRPGDNLFGNSVVAIDVETGERVWHFQAIHHDIWDRDFPHPPQLIDVTVDGEEIPALVQSSKQAFIYAFNRVTGEPIWPIEERPVPQSPRADGADLTDAAVPDAAGPVRDARPDGGRSGRLHTGDPVAGPRTRLRVGVRPLALPPAAPRHERGGEERSALLPLPGRRNEYSGGHGRRPRDGDHLYGFRQVVRRIHADSGRRAGRPAHGPVRDHTRRMDTRPRSRRRRGRSTGSPSTSHPTAGSRRST